MAKRKQGQLNERQQLFCHEYVLDLNGTQAAIRAGYSPRTAGSQAFELLKKPQIRAAIGGLEKRIIDRLDIKAEDVVRELRSRAYSDPLDYLDYDDRRMTLKPLAELTAAQRRAIRNVKRRVAKDGSTTVEFSLEDKTRNLELLGQHLGVLKPEQAAQALDVRVIVVRDEGKR